MAFGVNEGPGPAEARSVRARFFSRGRTVDVLGCERPGAIVEGSCCYEFSNSIDYDSDPNAEVIGAGELSFFADGARFAHLASMGFPPPSYYTGLSDDAAWSAGAKLSVAASGSDVAAFSGSVVAVASLTDGLVTPDGGAAVIPRSFVFAWTPSGSVDDRVSVHVWIGGGHVGCTVPEADGRLAFPTALSARLLADAGDASAARAHLSVARIATTTAYAVNARVAISSYRARGVRAVLER
ncbi:hypothetical protein EON77_06055 [bacterium]|nr:MAG: hypothetical protein EON77_06055 [bacterium]